jgi:hypothetical protein
MARNGVPSANSPSSYTGGMFGCGSFAVIFDSVTNRSAFAPGRSVLIATSRSSVRWTAAYTRPMPPLAISPVMA